MRTTSAIIDLSVREILASGVRSVASTRWSSKNSIFSDFAELLDLFSLAGNVIEPLRFALLTVSNQ